MEHLAGVLRSLREDAAITQEALAQKAGLSVRTVSDIERGLRKRLYQDTAEHLAAALSLDGEAREEFVEFARGRASVIRRGSTRTSAAVSLPGMSTGCLLSLRTSVTRSSGMPCSMPMNRTSPWRCGGQPTPATRNRSFSSVQGCGGTGRLVGTWRSVDSGWSAA